MSIFQRTSRHPVADTEQGAFAVECVDCHDPHADNASLPFVLDPDPNDGIVPTDLNVNYCLTCHDQEQARDMTHYIGSAHEMEGLGCASGCHVDSAGRNGDSVAPFGPHGSEFPLLTATFEEATCAQCHDEAREMSNAGTFTHHHVVDSEQAPDVEMECATCHDPHRVKSSPWAPLTDPHTGALVVQADVPSDASVDPARAANDTGRFCLRCHDGSWPGAVNIAAELSNESVINSGFYRGNKNMHRRHADEPNERSGQVACNYCHNAHGNTGSSGIQRGALLYSWMRVNQFPYTGKNSCGTGDPLSKCH
jgi:hypothetical protein